MFEKELLNNSYIVEMALENRISQLEERLEMLQEIEDDAMYDYAQKELLKTKEVLKEVSSGTLYIGKVKL